MTVTDPLMSSIMTAPQTAAVTDPLMSSINKQGNYCDLGFSAEDKLRQSSHLSTEKLQISQFTWKFKRTAASHVMFNIQFNDLEAAVIYSHNAVTYTCQPQGPKLTSAVSELLRRKHGTLYRYISVHQPSAEISSGLDSNPTCSSAPPLYLQELLRSELINLLTSTV